MGWTLRSAQPDSSGASQKKKMPPLSPEPRTTEKERLGGGRPRLRDPTQLPGGRSAPLFGAFPSLSLSLSLSLFVFLRFCFGFSFCPHLCFCLFLCLQFCPFPFSVFAALSLPADVCFSESVSLCVSSCPGPQRPRSARWPVRSRERVGRRQARARTGPGLSSRGGVSKGGATSPAAGVRGARGWRGTWGRARPLCGAQHWGGGRAPLPPPKHYDLPPLNRFSFAQRPELKASALPGA